MVDAQAVQPQAEPTIPDRTRGGPKKINYGLIRRVELNDLTAPPEFDNVYEDRKWCFHHGANITHDTKTCMLRLNELHMQQSLPLPLPHPDRVKMNKSTAVKRREDYKKKAADNAKFLKLFRAFIMAGKNGRNMYRSIQTERHEKVEMSALLKLGVSRTALVDETMKLRASESSQLQPDIEWNLM
ncbi:hypothetical protein LTR08_000040 [Meristemomyces frigidus]|nr:hypothetical protein LTR08_000040 [Meristemomyces frigidus]